MKQSISCWVCSGILWVFVVTACGGGGPEQDGTGGGGTGGTDGNEALQILETTPANMATDVATDVAVSAMFDAPLQETTVTTMSFTVTRDQGEAVEGTLSLAGEQTAVFTPDEPFTLLTEHTATLSTDIESLAGKKLEADFSWSFTTRDGRWGAAERIEVDDAGNAEVPQVAIDPDGNAVAVWQHYDGTRTNIWANRYTPAGGWGTAGRIETDDVGNAELPQVAIDPDGYALAVWTQLDGNGNNIWTNRYTPAGGWGTAMFMPAGHAGGATSPQIAMDPGGNAVAVWTQNDGTSFDIWANRYTPTGGWGTADLIETDDVGRALSPQIAMDPNGNAVAVWYQFDGTRDNIWANRYTPADGWGTAGLIETDDAGPATAPQIATDPDGNAMAVWQRYDGTRSDIWVNHYTTGAGWGTVERIDSRDDGNAGSPQVAIDRNGYALAVWHQLGELRSNIWANRYTPDDGWGIAERIETDDAGNAFSPQVAIDPGGNALAVWYQSDGTRDHAWANRFTHTSGWGTAARIEADDAGNAFSPQVAIDSDGNALAVWQKSDGQRANIWANRFD
jgi:hypothetical protein